MSKGNPTPKKPRQPKQSVLPSNMWEERLDGLSSAKPVTTWQETEVGRGASGKASLCDSKIRYH